MERQTTQPLDAVEFTYSWYQRFLDHVQDSAYDITCFCDGVGSGDVVVRHDVDLSLDDAVDMARIEAAHDVQTTYCILCSSPLYNPLDRERREQIREIESLGHEVGLHFSSHEYWDPDEQPDAPALERRIAEERAVLDTVLSETPETVSFHMPLPWALNRTLDGMRNTYAPAYFGEIEYVSDSGQRWRETPPDVDEFGESAQVLVHPGLWSESDRGFEERVKQSLHTAYIHAESKARREFLKAGDS